MPGGDQTGPLGIGSMTGRRMGFCAGFDLPGYANPAYGRGFGRGIGKGFGRGRGFRRAGFFSPVAPQQAWQPYPQYQPTKEQEKQAVENELKALEEEKGAIEQEISQIRQRLEELSR